MDWTWNYPYSDIDISINNGKLSLSGRPKSENLYGTALCLRPQTPNYEYKTEVTNANNSIKGLTMYGDNKNLIIWGMKDDKIILKSVNDV